MERAQFLQGCPQDHTTKLALHILRAKADPLDDRDPIPRNLEIDAGIAVRNDVNFRIELEWLETLLVFAGTGEEAATRHKRTDRDGEYDNEHERDGRKP